MDEFRAGTMRMDMHATKTDKEVVIRLSSTFAPDGLPVWTERETAQRKELLATMQREYGKTHVIERRAAGETTDREIVIRPKGIDTETLIARVSFGMEQFAADHELELDTGDHTHKRGLVLEAAKMKTAEAAVKYLLDDQLTDNAEKAKMVLEMLKMRKDLRRGGGHEGGGRGGA
ncbi:MAG: hypothetical protein K2Q01_05585 [Rickettsiales bacterium]|nr:hypothetical protein [Rickettsiales bacterium]